MSGVNTTELVVFSALFLLVTVLGFLAARWRRAESLEHLDEWGLGGRNFGGWVTWFLIGGDLYTAYTFVAVPALIYAVGAAGFFAVPYTIIVYPLVFLVAPRLWSVSHRHGYVTPADFVRARHGSGTLALAVAVTGIVATMPYIALQLVGIEAVIKAMGISGTWPLWIAFAILALYTYQSGLRAPALIAFVKDTLIYIVVIVAIIYIPHKLGGWHAIFGAADHKFQATPPPPKGPPDGTLLADPALLGYSTLALGSALALFLYPHSVTGILAASSGHAIRRNAALLPGYSLMLGLLALVGFFAIAAGVATRPEFATGFKQFGTNFAVPALFLHSFPSWFVGIAFAAIGIGALVPAAIMSIAAANLYTRNIHREFINANPTDKQEAQMAKWVSLVVKFGALIFIVFVPTQFAIYLQLLGGILIIQTLPSVMLGVFTRWFDPWALLLGWAVGMATGTAMFVAVNTPNYPLVIAGFTLPGYAAIYSVILNLAVAAVLTPIFNALRGGKAPVDATVAADYVR